jgi:hypothetical protein
LPASAFDEINSQLHDAENANLVKQVMELQYLEVKKGFTFKFMLWVNSASNPTMFSGIND